MQHQPSRRFLVGSLSASVSETTPAVAATSAASSWWLLAPADTAADNVFSLGFFVRCHGTIANCRPGALYCVLCCCFGILSP
jgi:hypothetical protein